MKYNPNYHYPYEDLCNTGHQTIYTKDLNQDNIIKVESEEELKEGYGELDEI